MIMQMQKVGKYQSPDSLTTLRTTSFFSIVIWIIPNNSLNLPLEI